MELIYLFTGITTGIIIGFFIGKYLTGKQHAKSNDNNEQINEINSLRQENAILSVKADELEKLKIKLEQKEQEIIDLSRKNASYETEISELNKRITEAGKELEKTQEKLRTEFKNIANELLETKSQKFTELNKTNIESILKPLNEKIKDFEKKVEETYEKGMRDRVALQKELEKLHELNTQISQEANNLTKALKGDVKKQGNWGEIILERILENSGLIKGQEYEIQYSTENIDGQRIQPDVVVFLPDNKNIIIDSKVSLVAYEKLVNADNEEDRKKYIKEHITSIKNHIKILSEKKYHTGKDLNTPEYVLLFVPIESSFSIAVQEDHELFRYAWDNKIVIVSPSTLIATLMTIASIWKQENQTRHAIEIAEQSGGLYDKFVGFLTDMENIDKALKNAENAYNEAFKKLHTGRGSLTSRVEKIKALGAKAQKSIPDKYLEE